MGCGGEQTPTVEHAAVEVGDVVMVGVVVVGAMEQCSAVVVCRAEEAECRGAVCRAQRGTQAGRRAGRLAGWQ